MSQPHVVLEINSQQFLLMEVIMGFWSGLVIGLFIGGMIGVVIMALCAAARYGDDLEEKNIE